MVQAWLAPGCLLVPAVARRLHLSAAAVRRRIFHGPLPATWHNGELVVAEADLAAYQRQRLP